MKQPSPRGGRPNSIGLQKRDLESLLDKLDRGSDGATPAHRDHMRWPFRQASLTMRILRPGSVHCDLTIACRNLSRGGISILHRSFIHPGTRVIVYLPHPSRGPVGIEGCVVRCIHRSGMIHEIGIRFDAAINTRDFVPFDPFVELFSFESVKPESLLGAVLYVDDSELDHRIIRHYLRETQVRLKTATGMDEGLAKAREGCDAVLCDCFLSDGNGIEFATRLRGQGIRTPVILVTSDTSAPMVDRLRKAAATRCLAKPISRRTLLLALAEVLSPDQRCEHKAADGEGDAVQLADLFRKDMVHLVAQLRGAIAKDDFQACRAIALKIKGIAPTFGFANLGRAADRLLVQLGETTGLHECADAIDALLSLCESVGPSNPEAKPEAA